MADIYLNKAVPDVVELPKAFHAPHSALHPNNIDYESFGNNPALKRAHDALQYVFDESTSINEFRAKPSDEDRAATHDRRVRERCDNFEPNAAEKVDSAIAGVKAEITKVESSLSEKAGLKPNPVHFDAITAAFHGMKPEKRMTTLNELIEQGDGASLATLIEAPLFLTGLTAEVRDSIKERLYHKVDPMGLKLRDHLKLSLERMDKASVIAVQTFAQLRAGTGDGEWRNRAEMFAARNAAANAKRI
jgi:hypothetical protein